MTIPTTEVPVVVIGDEVAKYFFPNLNPIGRDLRIGGIPYHVIGVIEKQGSVFGLSLDRLAIAPYKSPLHHLTNPRGDVTTYAYDSHDRLTTVTDALGNVTTSTYDANGNPQTITDARALSWVRAWQAT